MKIELNSVTVDDQDKALHFYTEVLGFVKKIDLPMGEYRWLTVVSPEGPDDIQLTLEPNAFPAAKTYQKALFEAGIPLTAFAVEDVGSDKTGALQAAMNVRCLEGVTPSALKVIAIRRTQPLSRLVGCERR